MTDGAPSNLQEHLVLREVCTSCGLPITELTDPNTQLSIEYQTVAERWTCLCNDGEATFPPAVDKAQKPGAAANDTATNPATDPATDPATIPATIPATNPTSTPPVVGDAMKGQPVQPGFASVNLQRPNLKGLAFKEADSNQSVLKESTPEPALQKSIEKESRESGSKDPLRESTAKTNPRESVLEKWTAKTGARIGAERPRPGHQKEGATEEAHPDPYIGTTIKSRWHLLSAVGKGPWERSMSVRH